MTPRSPKPIPSWQGALAAAGSVFGLWMVLSCLGFAAPSDLTFDERFMLPVVEQLADLWPDPPYFGNLRTPKDLPFVPAAILFNAGIGLEGLRLINLLVAICSAGLVGMLVTTRWHSAVLGGVLLTVLPYHTVLSHLFMSEPSFVLGSIILGLLATTGPKGNQEFGDHWPLGWF